LAYATFGICFRVLGIGEDELLRKTPAVFMRSAQLTNRRYVGLLKLNLSPVPHGTVPWLFVPL
jgi:hypothetical protein